MKNKVLIITVTRNNPVLLQHVFESYKKYDSGYDCDFLIIDHESDNKNHLLVLEKLSKKHKVETMSNNRVEISFDAAWRKNSDYKYYMFLHDDCAANKSNWIKVFVDRINSGYVEEIIKNTEYVNIPIGKVGAMHQPWRNYSSILGHSVQCVFLREAIKVIRDTDPPEMFKHADPDRCLVRNECLQAMGGVKNLVEFVTMKEENFVKYKELCDIVSKFLPYPDEGIPPRTLYPSGECWNKLTLTSEFLNSTDSLMSGWRTVGLEGDGFLEQIMGSDVPFGNNYITHYGQPNVVEFFARAFNTDGVEIRKNFNNKIFLLKIDRLIKNYFVKEK